uniref:Uncharacterized protein n=1 Tax=Rhizophora mucronata TaxID=61149 RepID=A0A2P2Q0Z8_RHIMU
MSWRGILQLSSDMQMQRYTSVKMNGALDPCATRHMGVERKTVLCVVCLGLKTSG